MNNALRNIALTCFGLALLFWGIWSLIYLDSSGQNFFLAYIPLALWAVFALPYVAFLFLIISFVTSLEMRKVDKKDIVALILMVFSLLGLFGSVIWQFTFTL